MMLEMNSRDEVVMKSESQKAGQELDGIVQKDQRQWRNKAMDDCS